MTFSEAYLESKRTSAVDSPINSQGWSTSPGHLSYSSKDGLRVVKADGSLLMDAYESGLISQSTIISSLSNGQESRWRTAKEVEQYSGYNHSLLTTTNKTTPSLLDDQIQQYVNDLRYGTAPVSKLKTWEHTAQPYLAHHMKKLLSPMSHRAALSPDPFWNGSQVADSLWDDLGTLHVRASAKLGVE